MRAERGDGSRAASRVTRLLLCSLAALAAAMGVGTVAHSQTPPHVRVESGELQGVVADGVASFKGIPFAAPPVGDLRWRPPQPAARWTGVRQAAEFGADCMQGRFGPPPRLRPPGAPPRAGAVGRLPVPERLAPRERRARGEAARDGLDLRGRVHGRLERLAQHVGRPVRQAGRRPRQRQLPRGALRLLRVPRVEPRAP